MLTASPTLANGATAAATLRRIAPWAAATVFLGLWVLENVGGPRHIRDGLDPSFQAALAHLFETGAVFGRDVIYTYGPFGFILTRTGGMELLPWLAFGQALLAVASGLGCLVFLKPLQTPWPVKLLFLALVVLFSNPFVMLPLVTYAAYVVNDYRLSPSVALMAVALGLLALVKGTGAVTAAVLVVALLVQVLHARRAVLLAVLILLGTAAWWQTAGQPLAALPAYFSGLIEVVRGYPEAMMLRRGPAYEVLWGYGIAVAALLLLAYRLCRHWRWHHLGHLVFFSFVLLAALKHAFVRHDGHAAQFAIAALPALAVVLLFRDPAAVPGGGAAGPSARARGPRAEGVMAFMAAAILVAALALSVAISQRVFKRPLPGSTVAKIRVNSDFYLELAGGGNRWVNAERRQREQLRQQYGHPAKVDGTVDIMPWNIAEVLVNDWQYAPRPTLQNVGAVTSALAAENASWLASEQGADWILFGMRPLGGLLWSLDEGLTWPVLWTRYEPVGTSGDSVAYARRSSPGSHEIGTMRCGRVAMGEYQDISGLDASLLWARTRVERSMPGHLAALLYKPARVNIELRMGNSSTMTRRFVTAKADRGFLLSPLVITPHQHARVAMGRELPNRLRVDGFRLITEQPWQFEDTYTFCHAPLLLHRNPDPESAARRLHVAGSASTR